MSERSKGPSPGPWRVDDRAALPQALANPHLYSWDVVDATGVMVCEASDNINAVLLAAAPQLLDHLQRWHVAAHPRGDDSCETCQFLKAIGQPITTPKKGGGR